MNFNTSSGLFIALVALAANVVPSPAMGDEGTGRCAVALWYFNGSGLDELGGHPITPVDDAIFVPTCGSMGLFAADDDAFGWLRPIGKIVSGTMSFQFELDEPFSADASFTDPVHFIIADQAGNNVGDVSVQLSSVDGKIWFVQEDDVASPDWVLRSTRSTWDAGVCYQVEIEWGPSGRVMKITTPGYFEWNEDAVSRSHAFTLDATKTEVLSRTNDSDDVGVTLNWLEVAYPCPPVSTEEVSWGRLKALYR